MLDTSVIVRLKLIMYTLCSWSWYVKLEQAGHHSAIEPQAAHNNDNLITLFW